MESAPAQVGRDCVLTEQPQAPYLAAGWAEVTAS